jgi:hypothetical protein
MCFGILLPLSLVIGFLSGSKGAFLTPFLMILIALHYLKRRVRIRSILAFSAFVVLVFPIFNAYRQVNDVTQLAETLQSGTPLDMESLVQVGMSRFYGVDAVTYAIRDTPGVMDFQLGRTVWPLTYALVPRQLWPDKPTVSFGKIFAETYFGRFFHGTGIAAAPTVVGEAYIDFHLPGMLLAALWCGFVLRVAYEYFIRLNFGAPAVSAYGAVFLYLFSFWEADIVGLIAYGTGALVLAVLAIVLMGATRKEAARLPAAPVSLRAQA